MAKTKDIAETPLMKQYNAIKAKYPDALLLFRVGDFYETFGEDAVKASSILGIVLTKRANGAASSIELAGFPHHAIDTYLPKLVKSGYRVAICDQLEDPKLAKSIVKRGVTELVTPGVSYNDKILENKENNFLASVHLDAKISGISFLDISTGEFYIAQGSNDYIDKLLQTYRPNEVVVQRSKRREFTELFGEKFYMSTFDDWVFTYDFAFDLLTRQFSTTTLKGFGIEDLNQGVIAGGAALHYLAETQHDRVQHICKVSRIEEDNFVWLDKFTIRNLELISSPNDNAATLLEVIDVTISPMGSRLMKRWVLLPLKDRKKVDERLDAVNYLFDNPEVIEKLGQQIRLIGDMERLISKTATGRINPREILQLSRALRATEPIRAICLSSGNTALKLLAGQLNPCPIMCELIEKYIQEDPPVQVNKGHVIAEGISTELDELRKMAYSGKDYLQQMLQREVDRTGISSLKIGYNNVFGYYLEVTNSHKDKVPEEWERKQTLVNAERYITEELKRYEEAILGAEEKIMTIENQLYNEVVSKVSGYIEPVQLDASLIARLDCLLSFATVSLRNHYVRPTINDSYLLNIKNGRHPVIEQHMPPGEKYIGNDVILDDKDQQIMIITGPNMSGKSALLRQTALIVLMAQMGCYVPADEAEFGIIDKVFTRVGASDNISSGESTFMVEMNETASILNNISTRSLILLDEIGRGTSTYDGISIAWAIAEFLHNHPLFNPKVLFATHYHELNQMATTMKRIKNYHVSVKEVGNKVIFLRKLLPGGSEHSFGIHVARMAGMPQSVLERANLVLSQLEQNHSDDGILGKKKINGKKRADDNGGYQLSFIQLNDPLLEQIKDEIISIDIDTLTPVEALMKLNGIKKLLKT
ncbi:MAG: DNA mismatch repair protein MutS [Bacteroidota bacterium]|nr:DNA mismatch repair protein MutS [Bacteroidota bacterium]